MTRSRGDYLTDQDAAEVFAKEVIEAVIELEHMGLPFDRLPNGKIAQRRFGGHTKEWARPRCTGRPTPPTAPGT